MMGKTGSRARAEARDGNAFGLSGQWEAGQRCCWIAGRGPHTCQSHHLHYHPFGSQFCGFSVKWTRKGQKTKFGIMFPCPANLL